MRTLFLVSLLLAGFLTGRASAQPSPLNRPVRPVPGPTTSPTGPTGGQPGQPGGAKPPAPGSTADAGSAKDDPNFNECKNIPGYRKMKVTLKPESTLADLVSWISSITCKRFIVSAGLRAQRVTIYSPSEVTAYEAYKAFLSALEAMNLTIQQSGQYYKIIEIQGAGGTVQPLTVPGEAVANNESFTTAMIRVKHASVSEVAEVLGKFKSKYGDITTYTPTNLLIITDLGTSITRLVKILGQLDVEGVHDERVWVLKVKNADAEEIAGKLTEVFDIGSEGSSGGGGAPQMNMGGRRGQGAKVYTPQNPSTSGGGGGVQNVGTKSKISKIIAEPRTNSLIIVANDTAYLELLALFQKLDVPLPGGEEKINIIYLENAVAEDMASLLSALTGSSSMGGRTNTTTSRTSRTSRTSTRNTQRTGGQFGGQYGNPWGMAGGGGTDSLFQGPVQIQPDPATNSLVIVASNKDFLALKRVIKELDRPRRQVFVEVTILEVSLDKTRNLGVSFHGGDPVGSGDKQSLLFGGSITNSSMNSIIMNPLSLMGLAVGLRGPEIKDAESLLGIPGLSFPSFGVMFQALQSDNAVNVISSPHILTTDNEEAEITVGENVPFQSGYSSLSSLASSFSSSSALTSLPMVSVQRQDVALKLKLTPHVNQSDFVRMEVEQEINEVKSIDSIVGPTTSKRKATTVVVVKDQQTVVIGGLITEKIKENVQKVPLLGDIPILGYMFKSTKRVTEKTNLLIFITPYVIRDESDLRRIFMEKVKLRKEFIEKYTSFKDHDFEADINYKHKHGFFEDINRTAHRMEEDISQRKKALDEYKVVDSSGPVSVNKTDVREVRRMLQKMREDQDTDHQDEVKPEEEKTPPADGKTPPADGKTPPADGKTPPADGKTPAPKPAGR